MMAVREILRLGHPGLRQRSREVALEALTTDSFQTLLQDLIETMRARDGVGLAAPQIGEPVRVVVIESRSNPRYPEAPEIPLTVLINPRLHPLSEEEILGWEGCLSVPGLRGLVPRWRHIRVQALAPKGQPLDFEARDFLAIVVQHEVDHLDGRVFVDRMRDLKTLAFEEEFQRYWREGKESRDY